MNTHAKKGKKTSEVERVIAAYHRGQNIFRRQSVSPLIKYIGELEARLTLAAPDAASAAIKPGDLASATDTVKPAGTWAAPVS